MSHAALVLVLASIGQPSDPLSAYFGFDAQRVLVVGDGCGPVVSADFNADGRPDLAIADNARSRVEIFYLRAKPQTPDEQSRAFKANEIPPNEWYDSEKIPVSHEIGAILAHDATGDGKIDLVLASAEPQELVVLAQESPSKFGATSRRRVRGLTARPAAMVLADVVAGPELELAVIVDGGVAIATIDASGAIGEPSPLGGSADFAALFAEDFDANGLLDLLAVSPDNPAPLRLWLQRKDPSARDRKLGLLAGEQRFEMPGVIEVQPVRFPARGQASIGVIERASRRIIFYDLDTRAASPSLGEIPAEIFSYPGEQAKDRSVVAADLDADSLTDLLATDPKANQLLVYRNDREDGLGVGLASPTFKAPSMAAFGPWAGQAGMVFVMSEDEKAVGVARYDPITRRVEFPRPISLATAGAGPVAMRHLVIGSEPTLAVVVKDKRTLVLELHRSTDPADPSITQADSIPLEGIEKTPRDIIEFDADRDGHSDLLLLTPNEPMVMVRSARVESGNAQPSQVLTSKQMGQFGLVQGAGPDNTANLDIDADGFEELLVADQNFVRACTYDPARGWRVVEQMNVRDAGAKLGAISVLALDASPAIAAVDSAGSQLLVFRRSASGWEAASAARLIGFSPAGIAAGRFIAGAGEGIAAMADDGFALVRLSGGGAGLTPLASFRSDEDDRVEHEMEIGDVNADGYIDAIVLDAGEQMCQIFTFSKTRKLHLATEFEVFESRLFSGGASREYEPSAVLVRDLTGDGLHDLALTVHDRVIIYPQMKAK